MNTNMVAKLLLERIRGSNRSLQRNKGNNTLALELIRTAHHGRFRHTGMANQGTFDFGSSEAMPGNVQDIIDSTDDPKVSVPISPGAVPGSSRPAVPRCG